MLGVVLGSVLSLASGLVVHWLSRSDQRHQWQRTRQALLTDERRRTYSELLAAMELWAQSHQAPEAERSARALGARRQWSVVRLLAGTDAILDSSDELSRATRAWNDLQTGEARVRLVRARRGFIMAARAELGVAELSTIGPDSAIPAEGFTRSSS